LEFGNFFTIIFARAEKATGGKKAAGTTQKTTQKLTPKQNAILQYLKGHPFAGRDEIVQSIPDITEDGVKYNLKRLQSTGLLKRIGPDKGGKWEVAEE